MLLKGEEFLIFWIGLQPARDVSSPPFRRSCGHGSSPAPLQRAGGGVVEAQRRPNESEMRKGLREVSDLPPRVGNILFSKQPNIIANCHQAFEQGACLGIAPLQNVSVGKPEGAGEEGAFSRRQTVNIGLAAIAQDEAIGHQLPLDRRDGATHARIIGRQETHDREPQQARIEFAAAEALRKRIEALVESLGANRGMFAATPD
jgi:hypothetical protein